MIHMGVHGHPSAPSGSWIAASGFLDGDGLSVPSNPLNGKVVAREPLLYFLMLYSVLSIQNKAS